jgi:hypothetical protein
VKFPSLITSRKGLFILGFSFAAVLIGLVLQFVFSKVTFPKGVLSEKRAQQSLNEKYAQKTAAPKVLGVSGEVRGVQVINKTQQFSSVGKIPFGVVPQDSVNKTGELSSLQQILGIKLASVSVFKQFGLPGNDAFDTADFNYEKSNGINIQLAWEPWNPSLTGAQSVDYLKEIQGGSYDSYIKSFVEAVKQYGGPVTLRFGHEMNGDWYPWGNRPADYVAAYRHVHQQAMSVGASNITWMWCVNETYDPSSLDQFYPGNDVVDVVGIDGFNWGTTQNYGGWKSFTDVFGGTYQYLSAHYNKPLVIAETGSTEYGGDKAKWVSEMFSVLSTKFSKVRAVVWFDLLKETDWRINSSKSSLEAFRSYFSK